MRSLLCLGFFLSLGTLSLSSASSLAAQAPRARTVAVWSATASDLGDLERAALRLTGRALPGAPNVESECDPSDDGCITSMLRGGVATHVLAIHVHWGRGGCVPMRGRDGERTGHRMLRVRVVDLDLYAADGSLLGRREVSIPREDDLAPIEAALAELLAL